MECTIKLSKYALQLDSPERMVFTKHYRATGALHIPNAITVYCKNLSSVTMAEMSEALSVRGT